MALGRSSKLRLATCDARLQQLITAVAARVDAGELAGAGVRDLTVLCGYRGEAEQNAAFDRGASKLRWPRSKHNKVPALAVDIAPYPINWNDRAAFEALREFVLKVAAELGIPIRVISWDLPHFELA